MASMSSRPLALQPRNENAMPASGSSKGFGAGNFDESLGSIDAAEGDTSLAFMPLNSSQFAPRRLDSSTNDSLISAGNVSHKAAETESRHEVIAIHQLPGGGSNLVVIWNNWNHLKASVDERLPTLVVSVIGDTEVGKSFTIRELMDPTEDRPFVQRGRDQNASTTSGVNLYCCRSLVQGAVVQLMDFEGENGSETPVLAQAKAKPALAAAAAASTVSNAVYGLSSKSIASIASAVTGQAGGEKPLALCPRAEAVREHFPRLAYTVSDVVVLVGTDPFFSTRYLERAVDFARRANAGVCDVDLPILLLISNRRDGDRCILDIKASTAQFMDAMGDSVKMLEQYFSALLCVYLPNKRNTTVGDDGAVYEGAALYTLQMNKVRTLLASLMQQRLANRLLGSDGMSGSGSRLITSRQGLWFDLVPKVVRELNAGRPVHVTRLVDEAWTAQMAKVATEQEAVGDILKALVTGLRPHPSLSLAAPNQSADVLGRFAAFHALAVDMAVRVTAARLRHVDQPLRFPVRLRAYAARQLETVLSLLDSITPCKAVYGHGPHAAAHGETGTPVDRPQEPVTCLQEARVHRKGHRSGRKIRGGGLTIWQRLTSLVAYSPVWEGRFEPAAVGRPDMETMLLDVLALVEAPAEDFLLALGQAARDHSGQYARLSLVPMVPGQCAPAAPEDCGPDADDAGLIRLGSEEGAASQPCLPYCAGCMRKFTVGPNGAAAEEDRAGASGDSEAAVAKAWYESVLAAVGLAGRGADGQGAAGADGKGTAKRATAKPPVTAAPSEASCGPVQLVCLGLCPSCWDAARLVNASERERKQHASLTMAEVE